ncbi:hypothetical protein COB21_01710 [Candidatus Aerophobetes bacterium]|uniref:Uncharacterized protein n=1 Tax=Aerophobetes bacterium TaxID=2030807 RepID=A0A2A4X6A5_UNCAE|nr:MAG: hypothetical protein COB21_01710 [Candidatus Aerophobetes bacterium]
MSMYVQVGALISHLGGEKPVSKKAKKAQELVKKVEIAAAKNLHRSSPASVILGKGDAFASGKKIRSGSPAAKGSLIQKKASSPKVQARAAQYKNKLAQQLKALNEAAAERYKK